MRFTAATEESAVEGALNLVGATRDEIDYDVLSDNAKGVTVRIRPHDEATAPEPAAQTEAEEGEAEESDAETPLHLDSMHDEATGEAETGEEKTGEAEVEVTDDDYEFIALDAQDAGEDLIDDAGDDELDFDASLEIEGDEYDSEDEDEADDDAESDEGEGEGEGEGEDEPARAIDPVLQERALGLTREFLDKLGLDAQAVPGDEVGTGDSIPIVIEGEDVGILIGKHGATLQSFQYLLNLTLNNAHDLETEGIRVTVDAGNYRARRQSSLESVARGAAQRARRESCPIRLEPMPANERRIVHNFLQSEPGIVTQSEGREPHRCVVIAPGRSSSSTPRGNDGERGMGGYTRGRGRGRR